MPSIELDLKDANDLFAKALRELSRLQNTSEPSDRADHAINLAVTIHHLGDWTYHHGRELDLDLGTESDFLGKARAVNPAIKLIHDVADTAKHHTLRRETKGNMSVDRLKYERIQLNQDFTFGNFEEPNTSLKGGNAVYVRTVVDDDEIVGFCVTYEGVVVSKDGVGQLFEQVCHDGLDFWQKTIDTIVRSEKPEWV
jgi:hypothetical protein